MSRCATPHPVRSVAFSPDGSHLAAGLQDGSFLVLDGRCAAREEERGEERGEVEGKDVCWVCFTTVVIRLSTTIL